MGVRPTWYLAAYLVVSVECVLSGCSNSPKGNSAIQITPTTAVVMPGQTVQFNAVANVPNVPQFLWEVNGVIGGSPSTGTISSSGLYTSPGTATGQSVQVGVRDQPAKSTVIVYDPSHPNPGSVATTQNPLVAAYAIPIPTGSSVQVQFGTETTYGFSTSPVPAAATGGIATVLVAGMRATTTYHMQAVIQLADGSQVKDSDHTFTTGAIPAGALPKISTQVTGVGTPSPGIELLSLTLSSSQSAALCAVATDLAGNIIWYYDLPPGVYPEPIKLLPNGHMLMITDGLANDVREIDLAGNIINQVTSNQITASLAGIPSFQNVVWGGVGPPVEQMLNHDVLLLPNGHLILLASMTETINNVPGIPAGTQVQGNALIDWDPKAGAVWTWSTFDHLDLSHAPYGLSDWTHGNALVYSSDDGNLLFSMRNQNWVLKINYQDGKGDGSIIWRLGPGGDFTLPASDEPIEWNYGQHDPSFQSANTTGIFDLMFFNNGVNRLVNSQNATCGSPGVIACYSSVPILQLNEYTMSANVLWEDNLYGAYSLCCGDALTLPSGNVEFDVALDEHSPNLSYVEEVTQTQSPELVWRMNIQGQTAYRGMRIPSLYPDQSWPATYPVQATTGDSTANTRFGKDAKN
jgi:arylsulfate sulfotransferase